MRSFPFVFSARVLFLAALLVTTPAFAQRDLKDIPNPDPEEERKSFVVAEGFEVNLYAADPLLAKPIQMNFDPEGRLWVASSEVYRRFSRGRSRPTACSCWRTPTGTARRTRRPCSSGDS